MRPLRLEVVDAMTWVKPPLLLGYKKLSKPAVPQGSHDLEVEGEINFVWNGRQCRGTRLHDAVVSNDIDVAKDILDNDPEAVHTRFHYSTRFLGNEQEGSGLAIHLAVSRGYIGMADFLLSQKADLASKVTRDHQDQYGVLHAAVWAEGRNDNVEMVEHLLELSAPITMNIDGQSPLHIAYKLGNVTMIRLIHQAMRKQKKMRLASGKDGKSALVMGIEYGKMTETQLAYSAAKEPQSLAEFIKHEPKCIPIFLQRIKDSNTVSPELLAQHVSSKDIAHIIRHCPSAACALIDAITAVPRETNPGWHPLPSRISFAPVSVKERLMAMVNSSGRVVVQYVCDHEWEYDPVNFDYPDWHNELRSPKYGSPVYDVCTKVCFVPDMLCAELFTALAGVGETDEMGIFRNSVIRGSINHVWWHGAYRVDILQGLLCVWGLTLLILEEWLVADTDRSGSSHARQLRARKAHSVSTGSSEGLHLEQADFVCSLTISSAFVGAKGLIDLFHEVLEFSGCLKLGRPLDYFTAVNLADLARCLVLMALFFEASNPTVRVLVIFICWLRLLEVFTSAEKIAVTILPIRQLVSSLVPALVVTLVGFCAFTHAFHVVWGYQHDWSKTFFRSFATLITTELPQNPESADALHVTVVYAAVLFFSIFIMNIFIGVIGTQYEREQGIVCTTFQQHRAKCCLNFLLRARILPTCICSKLSAMLLSTTAAFGALVVQVVGITHGRVDYTPSIFVILQLIMLVAAYQNPEQAWAPAQDPSQQRFLWIIAPSEPEEVYDMELGTMSQCPSTVNPGSPVSLIGKPLFRKASAVAGW